MISRLASGLRLATLVLFVAGCSQGMATTANPAPAASSSTGPAPAATASPTTSAAPSAAPSATAAASGVKVAVAEVNATGMGGAFNPAMLTIHVGDTVEWTNSSGNIHNVTFSDPSMHSPVMFGGDKWSQVFTKAGTYRYVCTYHPGMEGTIVVS